VSVICTNCTPLNTASSASTPGLNGQRTGKIKKFMAQMHHSCTLSGRKPHPLAPSPSLMERGPGLQQLRQVQQSGAPGDPRLFANRFPSLARIVFRVRAGKALTGRFYGKCSSVRRGEGGGVGKGKKHESSRKF